MPNMVVLTFADYVARQAAGDTEALPEPEGGFDVVFNIEVAVGKESAGGKRDLKMDVTQFPDEHLRSIHLQSSSEHLKSKSFIKWIAEKIANYVAGNTLCNLDQLLLMPSPDDGSKILMRAFGHFVR